MPKDINRSIVSHLYQVTRRLGRRGTGSLGVENLTMHQMQALFFVKQEQPVRLSELSTELSISSGSASLLVDRLVEAGWLTRSQGENDRRSVDLELSAEAEKKFIDTMGKRMEQAGQVLDRLEPKDRQELDRILGILQDALADDMEEKSTCN